MGFIKKTFNNITGKTAAQQAMNAQVQSNQASIDEQRRQFDALQNLLNPYVKAGNQALTNQQNLMGLNGFDKQQSAISDIERSPLLQSMYKQAENAILQNASATGGLRGGNIQGALADNRMNILAQAVQGQMQNLSGLTSLGQNAAAGVGNQGMNMAGNIGLLNQNIGQAQAGERLTSGQLNRQILGAGIQGLSAMFGSGSAGGFLSNMMGRMF